MNRQELLDFIDMALEGGAKIDIHFFSGSKEVALVRTRIFSEIVGEPIEENRRGRSEWLRVKSGQVSLAHHYDRSSSTIIF